MTWLIPVAIAAVILILVLVILIRTLRFKPKEVPVEAVEDIDLPREKIVQDMVDMVRCKTVSSRDSSQVDWAEFGKFRILLAERFPRIRAACKMEMIGPTGFLYHLPGRSAEKPSVCMAHYDVVPAEEELWSKPAFEGIVEDDVIWGRGTLDTKGTLCGVMEALELLLAEGFVPENDLYLSFSGEEEVDGDTCSMIVSYLEKKGVKPAIVVDEGGAVVDHTFPGVPGQCAMVGIAEKGGVNLDFTMASEGGHASTPPAHTILGQLSKAVTRIEDNPFPYQMTKPTAEMFDTVGRHSTFLYRMIFSNLWCFSPVLDLLGKKTGGELNALMRTTVAVTRMEGSNAYNVLPPKASFGINMRLLGEDTVESVVARLKRIIKNDKIEISVVTGTNPSPCSETDCEEWEKLSQAIRQTWPEAIVSPYLMMACSDSRNYCAISNRVYRFSAMHLSKAERAMIHGNDERIPVETLLTTVKFYIRLLKLL